MERGPLPPHERTWRHPSELAAIESAQLRADPGARSLRAAALMTGTLGLLAIGALALMVTPDRSQTPSAVHTPASFVDVAQRSVTAPITTPIGWVPVTTAVAAFAVGELANVLGVSRGGHDDPTSTTLAAAAVTAAASVPIGDPADAPLATPLAGSLGPGLAIVTAKAIAGTQEGDTVTVQLASGRVVDAEVVDTTDQAAFVQLGDEVADEPAVELADQAPAADSVITLLLATPVRLPMSALAEIGAPEGTAVVDIDGRLIGLCTLGDDGSTRLATVDTADTGSEAPAPTTAPATSEATNSATTTTVATVTTTTPGAATSTSAPGRPVTSGSDANAPSAP